MPSARPYARCPLSRAGKEIILDDDTTDVGVDAVLSADVGDAPMRQRQYTAPVRAPPAQALNGARATLRVKSALRPFPFHRVRQQQDGSAEKQRIEAAKQLSTGTTSVTSTPALVDGTIVSYRRVLSMFCRRDLYALAIVLGVPLLAAQNAGSQEPELVVVRSGDASLRALLWRPAGAGPFPAVLLNHGSGRTREELERLGPYEKQAEALGPVFARHGYVFMYLFRRGVGLSADQGVSSVDLMNRASAEHGDTARNALQLQLLENREAIDVRAALAFLRGRPDVDRRDVALVGDSFGSSLTLVVGEHEPTVRAVVVFATAGYSWERSPELRGRLLASVERLTAPVFFIHAANDYTTSSGETLAARLSELGRPHRLRVYPPIGRTSEEGHGFLYSGVSIWENDVFAFLDQHMRR